MAIGLQAALIVVGIPALLILVALSTEVARSRPGAAAEAATMRLDFILVVLLWGALTAIGEALVITTDLNPPASSDKGEKIKEAFDVLLIMAVPVFTMVIAVLVYGVIRRRSGEEPEDGPPIQGRGAFPIAWVVVTAALTVVLMVYPGLVGIKHITDNPEPDIVLDVHGIQWTWLVGYPDQGLENQREVVLPVDKTVRFDITSGDVLHSFWVPAFLTKIDAVPGLTTSFTLKPTRTGEFASDPLFRLQCAELCGDSHAIMRISVRVVSESEFESWVQERRRAAAAAPNPTATGATRE
jgi:cytochrome c oxidase subunit 2